MTPKQIIAFAIGPFGITIIGFVTLPFMTWFFNQEDIGRLALLNIAINFSILFFSLGLDQAYVREFYGIEDKLVLEYV